MVIGACVTSPNVINVFWDKHAFLSNFYHAPVYWDVKGLFEAKGFPFPTNEHAFQAAKYKAMDVEDGRARLDYIQAILSCQNPVDAKRLGQKVKIDLDVWENIKVDCMRAVVFEKFRQHSNLREQLLDTGHALLVEGNTWGDTFWGRCDGKGANILGAILMEVRGYWLWQQNSADIKTPSECTAPCVCVG